MKKLLIVPDLHAPFHDEEAYSLMLRAASLFRPEIIVVLGDFADFYSVSSHDKSPSRKLLLEEELQTVGNCLDRLDQLGAERKVFCEGNHEWRLERYLSQKAPELFGLVSFADLLKLDSRGWQVVAYKHYAKIGKLHVTHDVGQTGAYTVHRTMHMMQANIVVGHAHRMQYMVSRSLLGDAHVAMCPGWLGDFREISYMHAARLKDWSHGFAVGWLEANGNVHLQPVPIVKGACVVAGEKFT